jgi:dethiobiotin synthetase
MKQLVVAGIGTEIGKTFISALITEALEADYWKPIQAGSPADSDYIRQHISNPRTVCHPEGYRLENPMSPHAAAEIEGINIDLDKLQVPQTTNHLVIELAGGLMVPLNSSHLNTDLISLWDLPVILVSRNYLGSINHTLLSIAAIRQLRVNVAGIIFNGEPNVASEDFILRYSALRCIARVPQQSVINKEVIRKLAAQLKPQLLEL